jgi:preprotein translocase subunit SecE
MEKIKLILAKVTQFLKEAKVELMKVTWPTPKQTLASTSVVIVVVVIVSLFLGIIDFGLSKLIRLALG